MRCYLRQVALYAVVAMAALSGGCSVLEPDRDVYAGQNEAARRWSADDLLLVTQDQTIGGDLGRQMADGDHRINSRDEELNGVAPAQPKQRDRYLSAPDQVMQAEDFRPLTEGPETPKRKPDAQEMLAITIAASESVGDPNAIEVVRAGVDDTRAPVRIVCVRLRDQRLADENNRFNVFFGVLAREADGMRVSVIDSGPRATVACEKLGYI